jgi:HSP20 family protein
MLMHRFNPNDHFRTMDMLFDAILPPRAGGGRGATHFARKPGKLSLEDAETGFTLRAELPGLAPEQLELEVGEDWIEIKAKREVAVPDGYEPVRRERGGYEFARRITLPKRVDADKVEAQLRDGLLLVTLPKHASAQPRQITVQAA